MTKFTLISIAARIAIIAILILSFYTELSFVWVIVPISIWFLITLIGSFSMSHNLFLKASTAHKSIKVKKIALTFDDGPHPEYTLEVLDILERFNAKATFFCIGKNAEQYPNILKAIIEKGHDIGNHSYTHDTWIDFSSSNTWQEEIQKTDNIIENITGEKPQLFRPPYGVTTPQLANAIKQTRHRVIGWNNRSFDTALKNKSLILKRVIKRICPGGIILFHDTQKNTLVILEHLLQHLKQHNYNAVTITELFDDN